MEIWKKIEGYNYSVSDCGNIRRDNTGRILKTRVSRNYVSVGLCRNGEPKKALFVHRLMAETFLPNPDNLGYVNHINGIKTDNRLENLEWVNRKGNADHYFKLFSSLRQRIKELKKEIEILEQEKSLLQTG